MHGKRKVASPFLERERERERNRDRLSRTQQQHAVREKAHFTVGNNIGTYIIS